MFLLILGGGMYALLFFSCSAAAAVIRTNSFSHPTVLRDTFVSAYYDKKHGQKAASVKGWHE